MGDLSDRDDYEVRPSTPPALGAAGVGTACAAGAAPPLLLSQTRRAVSQAGASCLAVWAVAAAHAAAPACATAGDLCVSACVGVDVASKCSRLRGAVLPRGARLVTAARLWTALSEQKAVCVCVCVCVCVVSCACLQAHVRGCVVNVRPCSYVALYRTSAMALAVHAYLSCACVHVATKSVRLPKNVLMG